MTLITPALLMSCTGIGLSEADPRWADDKQWRKINNIPVTGDHTGFLGNLHRGAKGVREIYVNDVGIEANQGEAPYRYPVGTVVVKEQYKNPANNWAWSRGYSKEAKVDDAFCYGCHTIAMPKDFVFFNRESLVNFQ